MPRHRNHCGGRYWEEYGRRFARATLPHLDEIYSIALHVTGERAEAEEIVLETYAQAFHSFGRRRPHEPLEMWLHAILLQVAADTPPAAAHPADGTRKARASGPSRSRRRNEHDRRA
ncbi:hypothetical protein GWI34_05690 [Actinomadura sp. DSM 109109]|nr:hypothetical protein [Actinomadura lepetitiana]